MTLRGFGTLVLLVFAAAVFVTSACGGDTPEGADTDDEDECELGYSADYCADDCVWVHESCSYGTGADHLTLETSEQNCCDMEENCNWSECDEMYLPGCHGGYFEPVCNSDEDDFCIDELTLSDCIHDGTYSCDAYYDEVSCENPIACPCGSGCGIDESGLAACWCCNGDGGVEDPDSGAE